MGKLKKKITKKVKKELAKQIGKQIKKLIEKNVDTADPRALSYTQKYVEGLALRAMGEKGKGKPSSGTSPEISTKKNKKFKIKIKGMGKVAKDVLNGRDIGKSIKKNAGIFVNFSFKW